jgi:EAL domain-containing protein (putative c-di-GMP-specific phosphodiesterase class I)
MSFVRRINTEEGKTMLQTIVNMGKAMNLNIVAEGIEDLQAANGLRDMGVDHLQGFYFAKPKPPQECKLLMEANLAESPAAAEVSPALNVGLSR